MAHDQVPISEFRGIIQCLRITEPYMPDRVMRQFGYPQHIPRNLIKPKNAKRPPEPRSYVCSHNVGDSFEDYENYRCNFHLQTVRANIGHETLPLYENWFQQRTHIQVTPQGSFTPRNQLRPCDMDPRVVCFLYVDM